MVNATCALPLFFEALAASSNFRLECALSENSDKAHARRDVIEAGKKYPQLKSWAFAWEDKINMLFHLNNIRRQYPVDSKQFKREDAHLRKAVTKMHTDIEQEMKKTRLHHEQEKVLKSLKNHWEGLIVFIDHPHIPMDNNGSERTLRNSVVGRKNYYGSQTVWSGRFTAVMLSIFETLEVWGINQLNWLTDYLSACAREGGKPPADIYRKTNGFPVFPIVVVFNFLIT